MGMSVACWIRCAVPVLRENRFHISFTLLPLCYGNGLCLFDKVCCMRVMGKSVVVYLIGVSACALCERRLLI